MTLDGFLTVLALLAAIYAILPPVQQLRVGLTWRKQFLVAVPACTTILAFELFDPAPPGCPAAFGELCRWLVLSDKDPGASRKFAFLVALVWLVLAVLIHRRSKPSLGSLPALTQLATRLIDEEQYAEALKLLDPHMALLAKASRRRCLPQRLYYWLRDFGPEPSNPFGGFPRYPGERRFTGETWPNWAATPVCALARVVPSYRRAEQAGRDMLQLLGNSQHLLTYMAERRPYFALKLMQPEAIGSREFCERFLALLIAHPSSALFHELASNDECAAPFGYKLPPSNRLLHFLFSDAQVAFHLSAWKPVGDHVQRLLSGNETTGYTEWLNGSADEFDREQMRDPTFMGMFFFDIMVTSAARQGVRFHMWLPYLATFAERIEARYNSCGEAVDQAAEFPTRGARLLWELVGHLVEWVVLYRDLPANSPHRAHLDQPEHHATIPHAAANTLGRVLAIVVGSPRIDLGVTQTLNDKILHAINDLYGDDDEISSFRAYLVDALLSGGHRAAGAAYWNRLVELFDRADDMLQYDLDDYRQALGRRLGSLDTPLPRLT